MEPEVGRRCSRSSARPTPSPVRSGAARSGGRRRARRSGRAARPRPSASASGRRASRDAAATRRSRDGAGTGADVVGSSGRPVCGAGADVCGDSACRSGAREVDREIVADVEHAHILAGSGARDLTVGDAAGVSADARVRPAHGTRDQPEGHRRGEDQPEHERDRPDTGTPAGGRRSGRSRDRAARRRATTAAAA